MSYVDALFDREKDRIHVVERVDGKENIVSILPHTVFTMLTQEASTKASMEILSVGSQHATTRSFARNFVCNLAKIYLNQILILCLDALKKTTKIKMHQQLQTAFFDIED